MFNSSDMSEDVYSRLNYLYHAVEQLASLDIRANAVLIHNYSRIFAQIVQKKVLRVDHVIRRRICKRCQMLLVSGVTATVRLVDNTRAASNV